MAKHFRAEKLIGLSMTIRKLYKSVLDANLRRLGKNKREWLEEHIEKDFAEDKRLLEYREWQEATRKKLEQLNNEDNP